MLTLLYVCFAVVPALAAGIYLIHWSTTLGFQMPRKREWPKPKPQRPNLFARMFAPFDSTWGAVRLGAIIAAVLLTTLIVGGSAGLLG